LEKETDEDIVQEILSKQDFERFGELYDRYNDKVYHKCLSFAKNSDEAKDLLHDIFLKVFNKLSSFTGRSSFSTWLYSITYNYCVDYARKRNKTRNESIDDKWDISDVDDHAQEVALMQLRAERLSIVLDTVDPKNKALLLMKYQDGASIQEITEMLSLSESAVKMRLKRAKAEVLEVHQEMYTYDE